MAAKTPRSVVVADDDADYRLLVSLALGPSPDLAVVGEASHWEEAVERAEDLGPDVLLLDAALSGPGPVAVVGEVARVSPATLVVLTSTWPGGEPLGPAGARLPVVSKKGAPSSLAGLILAYLDSASDPAATDSLAQIFPADLASVGSARRWVRDALEADNSPEDVVELAVLLTSEVVTNAVVHGRSSVEISIERRETRVRIGVADSDQGFIRRRTGDLSSLSGRGVELVESMASSWGINRFLSGKQVWFELGRQAG